MNTKLAILLAAALSCTSLYAKDGKPIYVGDGRYMTCKNDQCEIRKSGRHIDDRDGYNESRERRQRERDSWSNPKYDPSWRSWR